MNNKTKIMKRILLLLLLITSVVGSAQTSLYAPITFKANVSSADLGINIGVKWKWTASRLTNTSSSGTIAAYSVSTIGGDSLDASSSTTYTGAYSLIIKPPVPRTAGLVTISTPYALRCDGAAFFTTGGVLINGDINMAAATRTIGTTDANALQFKTNASVRAFFNANGNGFNIGTTAVTTAPNLGINTVARAGTAWTTTGFGLVAAACTYTDQSSSGTVSTMYIHKFDASTVAASSSTTYTSAANVRIEDLAAGSLVGITNSYSLWTTGNTRHNGSMHFTGSNRGIGSFDNNTFNIRTNDNTRITILGTGLVGIGSTAPTPTSFLHLQGGTTATAPLGIDAGTLTTVAVAGKVEYDGIKYYSTPSNAIRKEIATTYVPVVSSAGTLTLDYATDYFFTGTTTTWTLPAVSATLIGRNWMITLKNKGSGNITINTAAAGNDIYNTSAVNTLVVTPGQAWVLMPDGTHFSVE